jgi:hypothetical protein
MLPDHTITSGKRLATATAFVTGVALLGLYAANYADLVRNYWATFGSWDAKSIGMGAFIMAVILGLIRFIRYQFQPRGQQSWPNHP